jgi:hypothetical protein
MTPQESFHVWPTSECRKARHSRPKLLTNYNYQTDFLYIAERNFQCKKYSIAMDLMCSWAQSPFQFSIDDALWAIRGKCAQIVSEGIRVASAFSSNGFVTNNTL